MLGMRAHAGQADKVRLWKRFAIGRVKLKAKGQEKAAEEARAAAIKAEERAIFKNDCWARQEATRAFQTAEGALVAAHRTMEDAKLWAQQEAKAAKEARR